MKNTLGGSGYYRKKQVKNKYDRYVYLNCFDKTAAMRELCTPSEYIRKYGKK